MLSLVNPSQCHVKMIKVFQPHHIYSTPFHILGLVRFVLSEHSFQGNNLNHKIHDNYIEYQSGNTLHKCSHLFH